MNSRLTRKLYSLLGEFKTFSHFSVDRLSTRDATNMPFMIWPNGSPCLIGNLYMQSLLSRKGRGKQGLSRKGQKGGSMGEYASKLSQLLRKCYRDSLDPITLQDGKFTDYIDEIRKETSSFNPAVTKKSETSVVATGKVWLDFLGFVGRLYGIPNFVSPEGSIRAREEKYVAASRNGRNIYRTYLTHHSFGESHREHRRNPITKEQIQQLKAAIRKDKSPAFVKVRRACMIELFSDTGGRRTEVANLKVDDVLRALEMEHPVLRLDTLKQAEGAERYVPVFSTALKKLKQYIEVERRKIMRTVYKGVKDHGYFFVSATTGRPLTSGAISNEINHLRKVAGIESQVCAHMFRHAFITNLFIRFIKRHQLTNEDDFRRALLDSQTFLAEVISWTGHLTSQSAEYYINLAFRDLAGYTETVSSVHLVMAMDKYFSEENELLALLEEGMPVTEYIQRLKVLQKMANKDFEIARQRESSLTRT
ncbi:MULTISPECIES: tyrosine-type recombinase/integrase [Pseudomonadaceae]|uniref:Site-specific integrase n=1 Tax=Stutzerimonas chloritidismutans TaxID=203192 RepID=A0ACC5VIK7_STUCH|nr:MULTISPECIES: tyrosine-type recombinase/integrase [Pseudomonadaceae]MBX7271795.1 site-specific integrase [Stutzerimonas chloritidismutans]MCQ4311121.1 site-specific integrase [Stutzerimonas stutzeri]PNG12521.1 integrase [Stutzerimonas stutzeri]|tara:strand:- start:726 stop:2159 length:1434 start_codon:yes stop_codon:yes gene_type:complete